MSTSGSSRGRGTTGLTASLAFALAHGSYLTPLRALVLRTHIHTHSSTLSLSHSPSFSSPSPSVFVPPYYFCRECPVASTRQPGAAFSNTLALSLFFVFLLLALPPPLFPSSCCCWPSVCFLSSRFCALSGSLCALLCHSPSFRIPLIVFIVTCRFALSLSLPSYLSVFRAACCALVALYLFLSLAWLARVPWRRGLVASVSV